MCVLRILPQSTVWDKVFHEHIYAFFIRSHLISHCHLYSILRNCLILLMVASYQEEAFSTGLCRLFPKHPIHLNVFLGLKEELSSYNKQNKIVFLHKVSLKIIVFSNVLNCIWIKWQYCCLLRLSYRTIHRKYVHAQCNYSHVYIVYV